MSTPISYDYIIAGTGCAGLSLAMRMAKSGAFNERKILLIDKSDKLVNDRTWCFWESGTGVFEPVVKKQWAYAGVHNYDFSRRLELLPYHYKLIQGIDFYNYCKSELAKFPNFKWIQADIKSITNDNGKALVATGGDVYAAGFVFNSMPPAKPVLSKREYWLLQHFRGWIIETEEDVFNPDEATLMDFRTGQQYGTAFVYVMPFSKTKALVEYTLFTEQLLQESQYEDGLKEYITKQLKISRYVILENEQGVIPMTNYRFPVANGHIVNIGTAGGQTKASSGYTFQFIQKHTARIVANLQKKDNPFVAWPTGKRRFHFYDSVLLKILQEKRLPGDKIFTQLFKKNKPQQVLRFLDNETSLLEEMKIISSLPTLPFLKAAIRQS